VLAIDRHCRRYLRQLRATLHLLRATAAPAPAPEVESALLAQFRAHKRPGPDG